MSGTREPSETTEKTGVQEQNQQTGRTVWMICETKAWIAQETLDKMEDIRGIAVAFSKSWE
jgi:hypothetical protein